MSVKITQSDLSVDLDLPKESGSRAEAKEERVDL